MLVLGTLFLSLVAAGCRPSAESVINKQRAAARQKLDTLRELAQAEDVCGARAERKKNRGERPPPPPPAVPLVFAGDDEPAEKRARVNAIAFQVEHYPRANGRSHHSTFQILPASRLVADAEALLASGTFADGRKPTGAEAQALFDALGRLRYGALLFETRHSPSSALEVPRAVLGAEAAGSGAKAEVIARGEVEALICLVDLETRLPAAPLNAISAGNLGVFPKADEARAAALRLQVRLRRQEGQGGDGLPLRRRGAVLPGPRGGLVRLMPHLGPDPEYSDTEAKRVTCSHKYGYADPSGKLVILPAFNSPAPFEGGVARVDYGRLIDRDGNVLWTR